METCCISFNGSFRSILTITRMAPFDIKEPLISWFRRGQTEVRTCMKISWKIHRSIGRATCNNISRNIRLPYYFANVHMCSMLAILFSLQHVKFSSHIEGSLHKKQVEPTLFIFFLQLVVILEFPLFILFLTPPN